MLAGEGEPTRGAEEVPHAHLCFPPPPSEKPPEQEGVGVERLHGFGVIVLGAERTIFVRLGVGAPRVGTIE